MTNGVRPHLLLNKTANVQDIVVALGYNDHKNFVTTFKKVYGMTPTEWQKSQQDLHI